MLNPTKGTKRTDAKGRVMESTAKFCIGRNRSFPDHLHDAADNFGFVSFINAGVKVTPPSRIWSHINTCLTNCALCVMIESKSQSAMLRVQF